MEQVAGMQQPFKRQYSTAYLGPPFIGATLESLIGSEHLFFAVEAQMEDDCEIVLGKHWERSSIFFWLCHVRIFDSHFFSAAQP